MRQVLSMRTVAAFSRCWTRICRAFSTFHLRKNGSADELVTRTVDSQNESRFLRLGFDLLPEPDNVRVHRTRGGKAIVSPDILQQPVATQGLSWMDEEILQKLELLGRKLQRMALPRYLATAQIHFDLAEGVLVVRLGNG